MRIGVLGTGMVGRTIADRLLELGHEVTMGSRSTGGEALGAWLAQAGEGAKGGSFAEAAASSELIFNATNGGASEAALAAAGAENLAEKTLVDVANPLDLSDRSDPKLLFCNDTSLAGRIQAAFPQTRVVKALNTVTAAVMTDPGRVRGDHVVFVCGEDPAAKVQVSALLEAIGWAPDSIVDLGGISAARGPEMYMLLWLRLWGTLDTLDFNIAISR